MFFCCPFWCEAPPRAQPRFEIANLSNGKRNARQNVQSPAIGTNLMAGQPSAPEDDAATLLPAEPQQPGYRVHGPCAAPVSALGAHGEEPAIAGVSNHEGRAFQNLA